MTEFLKKNRIHILIWAMMFVYIISAPRLHTNFFLKQGKPIAVSRSIPAETDQIKLNVDALDLIVQDRQEVYLLWGWAFSTLDPSLSPDMYEREILLISPSQKVYAFSIDTVSRPGVQEFFKDLNMNLTESGFSTLISKDVLPVGEYRIGIVLRDPSTGLSYYTDKPKRILLRTPNSLSLLK